MRTQTKHAPFSRLAGFLAAAVMACSAVPCGLTANALGSGSSAVSFTAAEYDLTVSGIAVTSENCADILGNGNAVYDPAANTLTLKNTVESIVNAVDGLTITLANDVLATGETGPAILSSKNLTINGSGSLDAANLPGDAVRVTDCSRLLIDHTKIYGSLNGSDDMTYLGVTHAEIYAPGGISGFGDGIMLYYCALTEPAGAVWQTNCTAITNADGTVATGVMIVPMEEYLLSIEGTYVNSLNCDDVLGNGVFSYDPQAKVLTINGSYSTEWGGALISSNVADLIVDVPDVVQLSVPNGSVFSLEQYAIITGSGKLHLYAGSSGIILHGCGLSINNTYLAIHGNYAINGGSERYSYLCVNSSTVIAESDRYAVSSFDSGIVLNGCHITTENCSVKNKNIVNEYGSPSQSVTIEPDAPMEYALKICGVTVHAGNRLDILGDGVFSYDPVYNVLTVSGDAQTAQFAVIENQISDLIINVAADSVLESTSGYAIYSYQSCTITGSGRLTVSGLGAGIAFAADFGSLMIRDMEVETAGIGGIIGGDLSEALIVENAVITASGQNTQNGAISGFPGGITISGCSVIEPENAVISGGAVCDAEGVPAMNVTIAPVVSMELYDEFVTLSKTSFAYTGSPVKVGNYITVSDGKTTFQYGTDFTISYENNVNVGDMTASVTVTGIGDYCGSVTRYFSILPKKQPAPTLTVLNAAGGIRAEWTADSVCDGFQIQYCRNEKFSGDTLHTVSFAAGRTSCNLTTYPKPGETWYLRVRAFIEAGKGTKRGFWSPVSSIRVAEAVSSVTLSQNAFAYTGSAVKCGNYITVKSGDTTLKYGTDFTISYDNNVNVGYQKASVTIQGTGNYTGTVTKKFSILPKKQPAPTLTVLNAAGGIHVEWAADPACEGFQLDYCQDASFTGETFHTVSLSAEKTANNLSKYPKPGETWYVRIREFIKDASGVKRGYWSPVSSIAVNGQIESVTLSRTQFAYTGNAVKCGNYITVRAGGKTLKYGTDFMMEYANNVSCGVDTASVKITGIGGYSGSETRTFTIVPKQQVKPAVTAVSGGFKVTWTKDANAAGYEVTYCKDASFTGESLHSASYTGTSATLTKYPESGETWYVKVRAFITKDGVKYGTYSSAVSIIAG